MSSVLKQLEALQTKNSADRISQWRKKCYPDKKDQSNMQRVRGAFANVLLGDRTGLTIIGPASVVKKIEKNPNKIELFMNDNSPRYRKKSARKKK